MYFVSCEQQHEDEEEEVKAQEKHKQRLRFQLYGTEKRSGFSFDIHN
jgi:hypothetical protein